VGLRAEVTPERKTEMEDEKEKMKGSCGLIEQGRYEGGVWR